MVTFEEPFSSQCNTSRFHLSRSTVAAFCVCHCTAGIIRQHIEKVGGIEAGTFAGINMNQEFQSGGGITLCVMLPVDTAADHLTLIF